MIAIVFDGTHDGFLLLRRAFVSWAHKFVVVDGKYFMEVDHSYKKVVKAKSRAPCITVYKCTADYDSCIELTPGDLIFSRNDLEHPILVKNNRSWFVEVKEFERK